MKKIYVGNLPFSVNEDQVRDFFGKLAELSSVQIVTDRETGRPRGFGFVQIDDSDAADKAVKELNLSKLADHVINVNLVQD